MKKISYLILFCATGVILIWSCQNNQISGDKNSISQDTTSLNVNELQALYLLDKQCFSCHHPSQATLPAPHILAISKQYKQSKLTESDFIMAMRQFLINPSEQTSLMPSAVQKYGLMPKQSYDTSEIRAIASYLYKSDIDEKNWNAYWEKNKAAINTYAANRPLLAKGKEMASIAKGELGKNLMNAIQQHGTENAITFCHEKAIPLTDSMAHVLKASLKRVSDQPRNPINTANASETKIIANFKKLLAEKKLKPFSSETKTTFTGYYPIETGKMCLQCHGNKNKDILPAVRKKIEQLYPKDLATGYSENQIRGMWVIEIQKNK